MKPSSRSSLMGQPTGFYLALLVMSTVSCRAIPEEGTPQARATPTQETASPKGLISAPQPQLSNVDYVAQIVQQVGPAVVQIDSTRTVRQPGDAGLGALFGAQDFPQTQVQRGTGSGFITTADGRVLTNAHVVEGADSVTVVLRDKRQFKGTVVGTDELTDIAVIKIDATDLPTIKTGDSDNLLPGQVAIAIGNPLGLSFTVTQGIISATGRSAADVGAPDSRVNFIQTDAAINPGNSGGPLLNAEGEVIGINSAIIKGATGLGFAIPMSTAEKIAAQIVAKGKADHPYLGIQMVELTPELRAQINQSQAGFKLNQDQGILIVRVQRGGPAARGGLRPGDIIESINGKPMQTSQQVQQQVEATSLDTTLEITVNRNGQSRKLTVKPEALPTQKPA